MPDPRSKEPRRRTLVLLFDGTGDQFDDDVRALAVFDVMLALMELCAEF